MDRPAPRSSPLIDLEAEVRRLVPLPGEAKVADVFLGCRFRATAPHVAPKGEWSRLERDAEARRAA